MSLSNKDRIKNIETMQTEEFDIVIVGGGISGAGVARDAALRGMRVALIESQDFAAGTSSRSSKLVHGGIRYLENLEFGLVFEALQERRNLFEMAPHLVHPLRFMLPVYKDARVGMFKLGLGMWLYDALSTFEAPKLHEKFWKEDTLSKMPMLNPDQLVGSYMYSDAYMDDDRLVIETLRSASKAGAIIANYVRATGAKMDNGKVTAVKCEDSLTKNEFFVRARHVVSTVGPWTDQVAHTLLGNWRDLMRPTKGVHLTFSRERLPLQDAVVMVSDDQKRIVFAIPRHEMVIIGTTDTDFRDDPKNVHTTREDVDYLLNVTSSYFPGAKIKESDIIASYSGVRPLVNDGSSTESKTSREHSIIADPRNVTFVTGGKYTTYRKIAEETMDVVLQNFSLEEQVSFGKCLTKQPLNPKATRAGITKMSMQAAELARETGYDVGTVNFLVERHGEETPQILYAGGKVFGEAARWVLEAKHAIHSTMCLNLRDFYLRRVPLFLARADHGFPYIDVVADVFQEQLSWSDADRTKAIAELFGHLKHEMGWSAQAQKN